MIDAAVVANEKPSMWFAVYEAKTGALISTGTVVADPLPKGLTAVALGEDFEDDGGALTAWDPASKRFVPLPVVDPRKHIEEKIATIMDSPEVAALGLKDADKQALESLLLGKF